MTKQTQRIRDPIHGLIVFDEKNEIDMLAWQLMQTPEFQRLRRIKQLGVSELVFPSATHTRFAHSIGVFHNARKLMGIVHRSMNGKAFDEDRARTILVAALLHDIGHGPFSHAFEKAREALAEERGVSTVDNHEEYTAKLILDQSGSIRPLLDAYDKKIAEDIAQLISAENPTDIYHAVVSSSFDADRLDYLMRDRYMTGTEAGSIDFDWLMDNLTTADISIQQDDDEPTRITTFVFKYKGRQAAEDFLLARFRLYSQVYLHKTTRGFEQLLKALIIRIGEVYDQPDLHCLPASNPLLRFLTPGGEALANYKQLDDTVVWGTIEQLRNCNDSLLKSYAERLWNRVPLCALDVSAKFLHDGDAYFNALKQLEERTKDSLNKTIFKDHAPYNLYSLARGEAPKAHKVVRVLGPDRKEREIIEFPDTMIRKELTKKQDLTRYYFLSAEDKADALKHAEGR